MERARFPHARSLAALAFYFSFLRRGVYAHKSPAAAACLREQKGGQTIWLRACESRKGGGKLYGANHGKMKKRKTEKKRKKEKEKQKKKSPGTGGCWLAIAYRIYQYTQAAPREISFVGVLGSRAVKARQIQRRFALRYRCCNDV